MNTPKRITTLSEVRSLFKRACKLQRRLDRYEASASMWVGIHNYLDEWCSKITYAFLSQMKAHKSEKIAAMRDNNAPRSAAIVLSFVCLHASYIITMRGVAYPTLSAIARMAERAVIRFERDVDKMGEISQRIDAEVARRGLKPL